MREWACLIMLVACGPKDGADETDIAVDSDSDADTDADTDGDTVEDTDDTDLPVTGCYDVPLVVEGGFGIAGDPFVAAPDTGSIAQLVHGPQGGWHIETAFRAESTHSAVRVTPSVTLVDSGQVISGLTGDADVNHATLLLLLDGECSGLNTGLRAFIDDVDPDPAVAESLDGHICALDGREVDVSWLVVDVTDLREGTDTVRATLALDPIDVSDCAAP
ncbi:MAG: hypothetical protein H0V89_06935 [Deltaproteobacteria bacterium]|nr:hypothetical protein [Deltaproteobacteria bacterium]